MRERFDELRRMGIRTVMITGDNPLTARAIAEEAGVDDFLAEATPEDKMALIRREQAGGALVAMTGDGTNDAPALAQADVGVAMNSGTQAAREAGNMVDLDSNPTKLIEIVEIGKQLLITRGSLTTFSIANDVAKYFAIIPAMFAGAFPVLDRLNVMHLATPRVGDPERRHLQRAHHRRADPARAARRALPRRLGGERPAAQLAHLRRWAASSHRSSASRSSTSSSRRSECCDATSAASGHRRVRRPDGPHRARLSADRHRRRPASPSAIAADGSLVERDGAPVGSVAHRAVVRRGPRTSTRARPPPATATTPWRAAASNLGPTNPDAHRRGGAPVPRSTGAQNDLPPDVRVPVDAITGSGSGLDPHISPANARLQARRVAAARGVPLARVLRLVRRCDGGARPRASSASRASTYCELNLALDERR